MVGALHDDGRDKDGSLTAVSLTPSHPSSFLHILAPSCIVRFPL